MRKDYMAALIKRLEEAKANKACMTELVVKLNKELNEAITLCMIYDSEIEVLEYCIKEME